MKNLSFYIPLFILTAVACNNESTLPPHSNPNISITNQEEVLNIYPLDTIKFDVTASTTSDEPISSFTSYNDCVEKLSKDPDNVYQDQATYEYKAVAPYEKGETEIRFTAYTDKGETSEITQKINVLDEPFMINIDSSDIPKSATDGSSFIVTGTIKSKIPFNNISFSTSVIEGGIESLRDDKIIELPHAEKTGFTISEHTYTKDEHNYSIYTFKVTYTVTAEVHDGDLDTPPTILDHFDLFITYNFYNLNQKINCSDRARFGNWTKTVPIK